MKSKIKMTYIPDGDKVEKHIIESVNDALYLYDKTSPINIVMLTNMNTVDINISSVSLFNTSIRENIQYVSQENIMNSILSNIKMNKNLIILNGYDIDLKSLRENIYPMLEKQSILFAINNISKDKELKIPFTYKCTLTDKMEEEDWNKIFDEFDKQYKEDKNKPEMKNSLLDFLAETFLGGLLSMDEDNELSSSNNNNDDEIEVSTFKLDKSILDDLFPKDFVEGKRTNTDKEQKYENEIIESASFGNKEHCLDIDLYDNGNIRLGADDGKTITIHASMVKFLINYLDTADI